MAKTRYDERTLTMMKDFMVLHEQGLTIAEIALKSRISIWTVYERLDEIAKQNHVSRDSLLQVIHSPGSYDHIKGKGELVHINVDAFQEKVNTAVKDIDVMIEDINRILKEEV